jgi:hypothetical protein
VAVLLTRWSAVALETGFVVGLAVFLLTPGVGGSNSGVAIAVGVTVGVVVMVPIALLAPRVRVEFYDDPSKLVVVNLFRSQEIEATAIRGVQRARFFRLHWSQWAVGDPRYVCVYEAKRRITKRFPIMASIRSPERDGLTALLDKWCQANGIPFEDSVEVAPRDSGQRPVQETATQGPAPQETTTPELRPPGRPHSYGGWRVSTWLCKAMLTVSAIALVAEVVIFALTHASPTVNLPALIFFPFFGFGILGTFVAVIFVVAKRRVQVFFDIWRLPKWVLVLVGLVAIGAISQLGRSFSGTPPGQPGYDPHKLEYYFDEHGYWLIVSRSQYLAGVAADIRSFITPAAMLTCIPVIVFAAEVYRRRAVRYPPLREIPIPPPPRPRLCPRPLIGIATIVLGIAMGSAGLAVITHRLDTFANGAPVVSSGQLTLHLTPGQWDVYGRCETKSTGVPYGCPRLTTGDVIVIGAGTQIPTNVDRTPDQTALEGLPSEGLLTFTIYQAGRYTFELSRAQPRGLFVAPTRAVILRGIIWVIAMSTLGGLLAIFGIVLLARRFRWRLRYAPAVIDTGDVPTAAPVLRAVGP